MWPRSHYRTSGKEPTDLRDESAWLSETLWFSDESRTRSDGPCLTFRGGIRCGAHAKESFSQRCGIGVVRGREK